MEAPPPDETPKATEQSIVEVKPEKRMLAVGRLHPKLGKYGVFSVKTDRAKRVELGAAPGIKKR